eukprot:8035737-Karenia_brevis.AAC.1
MKYATKDCPTVLIFDADCQMHLNHSNERGGLKVIDASLKACGCTSKYFSFVAKLFNVWRIQFWKIIKVAKQHLTPEQVVKIFRPSPPKCITGRWGSIFACEQVLRESWSVISWILIKALDGASDEDHVGPPDGDDADLDADERKKVLGKWTNSVVTELKKHDGVMEMHVEVACLVHTHVDVMFQHCHRFNMKRLTSSKDPMGGRRGLHFHLATGLADEVMVGFENLLDYRKWMHVVEKRPVALQQFANKFAVLLICNHASGYERRTRSHLNRFPWRLFKMIQKRRHCSCDARAAVAKE